MAIQSSEKASTNQLLLLFYVVICSMSCCCFSTCFQAKHKHREKRFDFQVYSRVERKLLVKNWPIKRKSNDFSLVEEKKRERET